MLFFQDCVLEVPPSAGTVGRTLQVQGKEASDYEGPAQGQLVVMLPR